MSADKLADETFPEFARSLLELSRDAILLVDRQLLVQAANRTAEVLFGYTPGQLVGISLTSLIPDSRVASTLQLQFECDTSLSIEDETAIDPEGNAFPIAVAFSRLTQAVSPLVAITVSDLRSQCAAADLMQQAILTSKQAERFKAQLLGGIRHEFRTPLNGILSAAELLAANDFPADVQRQIEAIRASADVLLNLVNGLLQLSTFEGESVTAESKEFDIRRTAEAAIEALANRTFSKGIELGSYVDAAVPRSVSGDAEKVREVLSLLLDNALKFTERGQVSLRITVPQEGWMRISVRDTGIGMSEEFRARLFTNFAKDNELSEQHTSGLGLGLPLAKHLVSSMGGQIAVTSALNKGTEIWFDIPTNTAESDTSYRVEGGQGIRALIVDSHREHAELVAAQVCSWGMRAEIVDEPVTALIALNDSVRQGDPFDVLLVDDGLPEAGAYWLGETISQNADFKDQTVLLMFRIGVGLNREECDKARFGGYLSKPVRQSSLYDEIVTSLMTKRGRSAGSLPRIIGPGSASEVSLEGHSILLADDNEINQLVAQELLRAWGCTCDLVDNGADAVTKALAGTYDLILMDCQMPKMDGLEATRQIRKSGSTVPIVALTANASKEDRERCLAAGMSDYLTKPLNPKKLNTVIATYCGLSKQATVVTETAAAEMPLAINLSTMLHNCMNNAMLVRTILDKFEEQAPKELEALRAGVESGEPQRIFEAAHSLKGTAHMIAAAALAEAASALEHAGRHGGASAAVVSEQLVAVEQALAACLNCLPQSRAQLALAS